MLKFDKLMLIADLDSIRIIDESAFSKQVKENKTTSLRYCQEKPYLLSIKIDYEEREAVVEFSGKVLLNDYPKLISKETIEQCFRSINALGFCEIDIEAMMGADVTKCDVTKDLPYEDVPRLTSYIKSHITNYNAYVCTRKRNNNLVLEKNVTTRKCKKRMTIYDKGEEMSRAENLDFAKQNNLEGAFDGICRFELNLNSKQQIRDSLGVTNTKLNTVLASTANPIYDFVEAAVKTQSEDDKRSDRKEYITMLVLKDCDYDLEKVEATLRSLYKRGTKFSEVMKPYRKAIDKLHFQNDADTLPNLLDMLR